MKHGDWGLGIWGLGIGDWGQSPTPHPPIPINIINLNLIKHIIKIKNENRLSKNKKIFTNICFFI